MAGIERRLLRLEDHRRRLPPPPPAPPGFDAKRLDSCEMWEMDRLLERVEYRPDAPSPFARWDGLEALCDCRLERLRELTGKAHGLPPATNYRHLGPGAVPCPDPGCLAGAVEAEVAPCRRVLAQHRDMMEVRRR